MLLIHADIADCSWEKCPGGTVLGEKRSWERNVLGEKCSWESFSPRNLFLLGTFFS